MKRLPDYDLLSRLRRKHPDVELVLASKYLTAEDFQAFLDAGVCNFGESRAEALEAKRSRVPEGVRWHYLGPLQTKKVKKIAADLDCLHSLDRLKLARELDRRRDEPLPCYVQVNISGEPQKHGVEIERTHTLLKALRPFRNIHVVGLMGMASQTDDTTRIQEQFATLRRLRDEARRENPEVEGLSMGMSEDYETALEEGATILRLGRILIREGDHE